MVHWVETLGLLQSHVGTARSLTVHRFGTPGAAPKIYLQAGLHAAEVPGMVIARHLLALLRTADDAGQIKGEVVVVPAANPIGLGTTVMGVHVGRHAVASGQNYNRNFPDLAKLVLARDPDLGGDAAANTDTLRRAMIAALTDLRPKTELEDLRRQLMLLAADADYVYDLHAEEDALFAAVLAPFTLPFADELLGDTAPVLTFWADYPPLFDTALSRPWAHLAAARPDAAIPQACKSVTLELRGSGHVDDAQARADAEALFATFLRLGAIAGTPAAAPAHPEPMRFEGVEFIRAAAPGIVVYHRDLGDTVRAGEVLAHIVLPDAAGAEDRIPVTAATDGTFFARCHATVVQRDDVVAKVAGPTLLADPKHY